MRSHLIPARASRRRHLALERLEERQLLSVEADEQQFVYLLNRARHDPLAYQQENNLTVDLSSVSPRPPLAVNDDLFNSSDFHATEMAVHNYVGHQSQVTGDWPNKMARDQGYVLDPSWANDNNYIESIAAGTSDAPATLALLIVDAGVPSLGHRNHLLGIDSFNADNREIGVGHAYSATSTYGNYWAIHATRTSPNDQFLTGVVFNDLNGNGRYDLNEGLAGVTINAAGQTVLTNAAGGWSIKAAAGTYTVTASGGAFVGQTTANATVDGNVEVDFISGQSQAEVNFVPQGGTSPSITSANVASFSIGTAGSFVVMATGNPAPTLIESGTLPSGVKFDSTSGELVGMPDSGTTGTYKITFTAHNGVGSDFIQPFTLTVNSLATAEPDTFVLAPGGGASNSGATSVLANDTSADGQPQNLTATLVSTTTNGTLTLDANGSFTYLPGPAFQGLDSFTYKVSEGAVVGGTATVPLLSYHASLVDKLYNQVLHRSPINTNDTAGLFFWTSQLDQGQTLDVVAQGIFNSPERLNPLVTNFYNQFLLRQPDTGGLAFWVADWQRTGDPFDVAVNILGSPEFLADASNANPNQPNNNAFVSLLYARVLGTTTPDTAGFNFWTGQLNSGQQTMQQVANAFEWSPQNHIHLVQFLFGEYFKGDSLSQVPSQQTYIDDLDNGQTQTQVELEIFDSSQYQNLPPAPAAGTVGVALFNP